MTSQQHDYTYNINNQKQVTLDVGEWDRVTAQIVAPVTGTVFVYGSNDGGAVTGVTQGNAKLATNFNPAEVTNLATHAVTNTITAAGNYKYLRLAGGGISVYKLLVDNMKIF